MNLNKQNIDTFIYLYFERWMNGEKIEPVKFLHAVKDYCHLCSEFKKGNKVFSVYKHNFKVETEEDRSTVRHILSLFKKSLEG